MQDAKLVLNGYIIQKAKDSYYRGIDGDNWFLNYCSDNIYFAKVHEDTIDNSMDNPERVECTADVDYMKKCVEEAKNLGILFRVLLCATSRPALVLGTERLGQAEKLLGYDVAYSGGSFYSCVLNDVVSGRIPEFQTVRLNENGLFSSYEETDAFLEQRKALEKTTMEYIYEKGDYVIYQLMEVTL